MREKLMEARKCAEHAIGLRLPDSATRDVLMYAWRKLKVIEKPANYLPMLYENELRDYAMRLAVNTIGGAGCV